MATEGDFADSMRVRLGHRSFATAQDDNGGEEGGRWIFPCQRLQGLAQRLSGTTGEGWGWNGGSVAGLRMSWLGTDSLRELMMIMGAGGMSKEGWMIDDEGW